MKKNKKKRLRPQFFLVLILLLLAVAAVAAACRSEEGEAGKTTGDPALTAETTVEKTAEKTAPPSSSKKTEEKKEPAPTVIASRKTLWYFVGDADDLASYATAKSADGEALPVTVEGNYDLEKIGTYRLKWVAASRGGAKGECAFTLEVGPSPFKDSKTREESGLIDGTYKTRNGFDLVVKDGIATIDGQILANKTYALPKTYYTGGLTPETEAAFSKMIAAAKAEGLNIYCRSGHRAWTDQYIIFNNYVKSDGQAKAETYSARPGHSEHQTGLAFDLINSESERVQEFKKEFDWLSANAWKYGFILRYPNGKTAETGYIAEPWHYRYVGDVALAEKLYNNGNWLTMEDYYGIDSTYKFQY